jgi:hypothetical protein
MAVKGVFAVDDLKRAQNERHYESALAVQAERDGALRRFVDVGLHPHALHI